MLFYSLSCKYIYLYLVKPYFIKSPEKKSVDQGTPVDLVCLVGGDPPPDIRWTGPKGTKNIVHINVS